MKHLHESRGAAIKEMQGLIELISKGEATAEQRTKFDDLENKVKELDADIQRAERAAAFKPYEFSAKEEKEVKKFNYRKAIQDVLTTGKAEGLEAYLNEIGEAENSRIEGRQRKENSIVIPSALLSLLVRDEMMKNAQKRATMTIGTSGSPGEFYGDVPVNVIPWSEALFAQAVLGRAGATVFSGLTDNQSFVTPGVSTFAFLTETGTSSDAAPDNTNKTMIPRPIGGYIPWSNRALRQRGQSAYDFSLMQIMNAVMAIQEKSVFQTVSNANTSLQTYSGIEVNYAGGAASNGTNADGAALVYADFVNQIKLSLAQNVDQAFTKFIANGNVAGKGMSINITGSGSEPAVKGNPLVPGEFIVAGKELLVTGNVPNNLTKGSGTDLSALYFGDWRSVYVGQWGGIEILVNPYATTNQTRFEAIAFFDHEIENPDKFVRCIDIVTT